VDAKHFSGPLSPYVNAMWFRLFGPGVMTLAMANLALAVLFVALLYWLLARLADRFAATIACFLFIVSFGCAQYTVTGSYNWLCPYSHELTHGVMLAVAGLACIARYQDGRRVRWAALAGLVTGLIALTKVEVMVAGIPAIALGLTVAAEPRSERRTAAVVAAFVGAAAVPLVATWLWFAPVMTPEQILRWPLGHWRAVGRGSFLASPFYRHGLGIDAVRSNLWTLGVAGVGWLAAVGAAVLFGRSRLRHPVAVVLGALVGWARHRREPVAAAFALRAALALFALGMLAKMVLNVRIYQYGFALAAPAAVAAVVALLAWLPAAVGRAGGWAPTGRAVVLGLLAAAMSTHVATTRARIADKVRVVGTGRDAFYTDKRGLQMKLLLEQMQRRLTKDATVVTFPEGAFVNYLARHRNPTPFYIFDRTTMKLWGEDAALEALQAHPPDWVVIVDRGLEVPPPKTDLRLDPEQLPAALAVRVPRLRRPPLLDHAHAGQDPVQPVPVGGATAVGAGCVAGAACASVPPCMIW
jgi:hypothetical protein